MKQSTHFIVLSGRLLIISTWFNSPFLPLPEWVVSMTYSHVSASVLAVFSHWSTWLISHEKHPLLKLYNHDMFWCLSHVSMSSLVAQSAKRLPAMQKTWDSIPGSGRYLGEGNSNPLQYSCLKSSTDRGAWRATVHGVTKSWTRLSD